MANKIITDGCRFEKEAEQSGLWPNWKYNPDPRQKRLTKCNKVLDLSPNKLEYEARVLHTQQWYPLSILKLT
jgi:hypothetical protein